MTDATHAEPSRRTDRRPGRTGHEPATASRGGTPPPSSTRQAIAPQVDRLNMTEALAGIEYDEDRQRASLPATELIELLDELLAQRRHATTMFSQWIDTERAVHSVHRPIILHGGRFCQADGQPSPCGTIREMYAARGIAYGRPGPFGAEEGGLTFTHQEAVQAEANYHRTGRYTTDPPLDGPTFETAGVRTASRAGSDQRPLVYRYAAAGRVYHWPAGGTEDRAACGQAGLDPGTRTDPSGVGSRDRCGKGRCRTAWESYDDTRRRSHPVRPSDPDARSSLRP